ncbi:MAG TPA: carboxypeptidase-like regulatory domain-containing protein [Longimicrobiaceae bacterium]|nr:carboxypeptidase-like regulatory domain-containing protein [Longimicrobiaceae bacterium]
MKPGIRMDRGSRPVILLLALAAALLLAGFRPAQDAGRIVGRVTDTAGNPLAGAVVSASPADPAAAGVETRTGETGGFQLAWLPPGRYTVRASVPGYAPAGQEVTLPPGGRETAILRLRPARSQAIAAPPSRPVLGARVRDASAKRRDPQ